jgi:hypothetical protein
MKRGLVASAAFGFVTVAQATTTYTYTYTGPNFNAFSSPAGAHGPTNRVTGSFTLATPLGPNLALTDVTAQILSYSFSDGVQTLNSGNSQSCLPTLSGLTVHATTVMPVR